MRRGGFAKAALLHLAVLALLFGLQFVLSDYNHLTMTRIMVLAVFAVGYNVLFGYTGLLSLGHALFFATGLYTAGMTVYYFGWDPPLAFLAGVGAGLLVAFLLGLIALRTTGVSFMIVTMMFAQVGHLATLYFGEYTRGDEGLTLPTAARSFTLLGHTLDLTSPVVRYNLALALLTLAVAIVFFLVRGATGRVFIAIRENEERTRMLGYNAFARKLQALVISGGLSAAAGAAYALLFAYVGSSFASIQYSIEALLFTLLGGAGTVLGPLVGAVLMFYLIDQASGYTSAYLIFVGAAMIALILWFPKGLLGTIREKWLPWLP